LLKEERGRRGNTKQFYLDTNVFISHLKPDDPFHAEAEIIASNLKSKIVRAETSVLTLVETASVISRLYGPKIMAATKLQQQRKEEEARKKSFIIIRALRELAGLVTFVSIPGDSRLAFGGEEEKDLHITMPSVISESIISSFQSSLRSLDLVHVAAARYARQKNSELAAFVTGDRELLSSKRKEILDITGMPAISPKDYVESAGLMQQQ
jgi:predicted nucleic acid-binding protein